MVLLLYMIVLVKCEGFFFNGYYIISVLILYSIGRTEKGAEISFKEGTQIVIGSYECELSYEIDVKDFESGAFFAMDDQ